MFSPHSFTSSLFLPNMQESTVSIIVSSLALIIAITAYYHATKVKPTTEKTNDPAMRSLQLQAYERLVLLAERISLPALISRSNHSQLSAREMQAVLSDTIKQEFAYNASQQIYVSPSAWNAVQNLKDQNLLIINQISNTLSPDASATDLNKHVLEVIIAQKEKALHTIVLDALNFEAKKIMQ